MTALYILGGILVVLFLLYAFALRCRKGHSGLEALRGWNYAHRGLHGQGIPENSMAAFREALEGGYGIELDVHLMADGNLAVIHDPSLKRTAGVDVHIEDLTLADLDNYRLEGTDEKIPTLPQVLALYDGKAPMIVELKPERNNHAALTKAVCDLLDGYHGVYCLESFDPRCIHWLRKNRPELIRGQLGEDFVRNPKSKLPTALKWALTLQLENFLVVPDFVSYKFADRKKLGIFLARKLWGAQGVSWTITSQADLDAAVREGWLPIFEGFRP